MSEIVPPPNFSEWPTNRLRVLLEEYAISLPGMRTLYGRNHPEVRTHQAWVEALQVELDKRER